MITARDLWQRSHDYFSKPGAALAKTSVNSCMYREKVDGRVRKCAVGLHIPDSLYSHIFEGMGYFQLLSMLKEVAEGDYAPSEDPTYTPEKAQRLVAILDDDRMKFQFLREAQRAHDQSATDADDLVRYLDDLAAHLGIITREEREAFRA
jgi:hypothetical protein